MATRRGRKRAWAKSRRWTAAQAVEVLGAFEESGYTLRDFAEREGITEQRLVRWRRRLGSEVECEPKFVELKPADDHHTGGGRGAFEIVLCSGQLVRVPADFEAAGLRRLLAVLEERTC